MEKHFFSTFYDIINSTEAFKNIYQKAEGKFCRFCQQDSTQTTFNNLPHIIPELLGKNNYSSNNECDKCNSFFGRFETDLSNFISPYQTLISQKTKNGIPVFQSRKKGGLKSTVIERNQENLQIDFKNNLSDFYFDEDKKIFQARFKKKKYVPVNVYKCFVKIAFSMLPEEYLIKYIKTLDWLLYSKNPPLTPLDLIWIKLKNKLFKNPSAFLYKRNMVESKRYYPELCLIVRSGISTFQIFIPLCEKDEKCYDLIIYPDWILDIKDAKNQDNISINLDQLSIISKTMNGVQPIEENEIVSFSYNHDF